ncbi:hypothetical protein EDC04DRAFT_2600107 [Pisolithus marmoratus]|nr:hypothetical protein EDC04DRAFT_2600107 [Pisolithus marmoratus]
MWKQVDHCYHVAFSLCGSILTIFQYMRGGPCYDPWIIKGQIGNLQCKQVNLFSRRKEYLGNGDTKLVKPTTFMLIHLIFMSYGLKGRGTCIWFVQDALDHYYIFARLLAANNSCEDPQFALEVRGKGYEAIFGDKDKYHVFNDLLFKEKNYPGSLKGIPPLCGDGDFNWPEDKDLKWYPKQTGMLGDWGYGEDFGGHLSRQRDDSCSVTGTFPFQAMQIMAWEAKLPWAGWFMGHSMQHDLEAIMLQVWVLCINLDGPFNKRRFKSSDFKKPFHLSSTMK